MPTTTAIDWTLALAGAAPTSWDHGSHVHGPNELTDGFVVAITRRVDDEIVRDDQALFLAGRAAAYGPALAMAKDLRTRVARGEHGPDALYAVVDALYSCGCRVR